MHAHDVTSGVIVPTPDTSLARRLGLHQRQFDAIARVVAATCATAIALGVGEIAAPADASENLSMNQIRFETIREGERSKQYYVRACNPAPVGTQLDISFQSPWHTGVVQGNFAIHGPQQYGLKGGPFRQGECHNTYFQMIGRNAGRETATVYFHFDNRLGKGWVETVTLSGTVLDTTAPDTTIVGPTVTEDQTPTFRLKASEGDSTFECKLDGGQWTYCDGVFTTPPLGHAPHVLEARATDATGNVDKTPARHAFEIVRQRQIDDPVVSLPGAPVPGLPSMEMPGTPPRPATPAQTPVISELQVKSKTIRFRLRAPGKVRLTAVAKPRCKNDRCGDPRRATMLVQGRKGRNAITLAARHRLLQVLRAGGARLTAAIPGRKGASARVDL